MLPNSSHLVARMTDAPTSIQPIFKSQEEIERLVLGLSIVNGKLYAHIVEKDVNPRDCDEYKQVAQTYYAVLQNVDHLIALSAEKSILSKDPKERADQVGELIEQIRGANIGKIGLKIASFIELSINA
jgi:hypothetical protein